MHHLIDWLYDCILCLLSGVIYAKVACRYFAGYFIRCLQGANMGYLTGSWVSYFATRFT